MKKYFSLIAGLLLFSGAVGILLFNPFFKRPYILNDKLLDLIPRDVPGWAVRDIPIAESEEMKKAVNELLNYESAIFREYQKGGRILQIYVAYWPPKKFNPRMIADHTPDICWVSNGWEMSRPDYNYQVPSDGVALQHAQYRLFEAHGSILNVIYWHVVDGRLSGYAEGINSRSNKFTKNIFESIKSGSGEQFFIRLSSPQAWPEWRGDPLYESILRSLAPVLNKPAENSAGGR